MEMTIQELQSAIRVAEDKLDELNSQQSNDCDVYEIRTHLDSEGE